MNKICPQCKIEMKLSPKSINQVKVRIDKPAVPYLINEGDQYTPYVEIYICPKCGLIQQYIAEEHMDFLEDL